MGGTTIAEVLRQAGDRLAHKQWLIFYPLALAIVNTLAFLAIFTAAGGEMHWGAFFAAHFDRWDFVHNHFLSGFSVTPAFGVAVFVGLAACVFAAMLRAPLFRAIAGPGYPLAPRSWEETGRLALFYVFYYLVVFVLPLVAPSGAAVAEVAFMAILVIGLLLVYADYVIVFEGLSFVAAMRRSIGLLTRRWPPALVLFAALLLVTLGLQEAYRLYYQGAEGVFLLVPLSEILVWSFMSLVFDLLFIFLYEQVRHSA